MRLRTGFFQHRRLVKINLAMAYPSLLFIHGEGTAAWLWEPWRRHLRPFGWETNVLDLRGHGRSLPVDFTNVTLEDYVADIESVVQQIGAQSRLPVLAGWGIGGLLALMLASRLRETPAAVLFAPVAPKEAGGGASLEALRGLPATPLGPEHFGVDEGGFAPDLTEEEKSRLRGEMREAAESGVALRQAERGVSVPPESVAAAVLVVSGEMDEGRGPEQGRDVAAYYGGQSIVVPEVGRWGLVWHEAAVADTAWQVDAWLKKVVSR
jgi:pimeloyl-ACP methyl ester carboxylesterase